MLARFIDQLAYHWVEQHSSAVIRPIIRFPKENQAMKNVILFLSAAVLAACGQSNPTTSETEEFPVANPARLKELREQYRLDCAVIGDALCNRVAEAIRRWFYGDGIAPYTPLKKSPRF